MKTLEEIKGRCFIDEDGHWMWRGAVTKQGKPSIHAPDYTNHKGKLLTHQSGYRAVWHVVNQRAVPKGSRIFSMCGEAHCCNPEHIRCMPTKEYGRQQRKKGTLKGQTSRILANQAIGRKRAKVTPEQVSAIMTSDKSCRELSEITGLSNCTIWRVRTGQSVVPPAGAGFFPTTQVWGGK